jgi:uncharacterized protein (DUF2225 family)
VTNNVIECPFCFFRYENSSPKAIAKGQLQCVECGTVFGREVVQNPYIYSLNKNIDSGIRWDR